MSREQTLVDADWVEAHLDDPKVVLVEVDEDTSAYDKNHIKGAVRIDWKQDLQDPVRRDFVDQAGFEKLLSERGIANDDTVVLYGGNNNWFASYAYWYFKLYGHDDVKLLDGGRKKWELDSRELVAEVRRASRDDLQGQGPGQLDPRLPRRGRGGDRQPEPRRRPLARRVLRQAARPGPPPAGAVAARRPRPDRPQHPVVEGGQRRRHLQVRRRAPKLYEDEGVDFAKDTIAYCRIGERSAHTWFVLHELLGQPNVKNYDGSWTEYGSLVGVPIELGDDPGAPDMCGATAGGPSTRGPRRHQRDGRSRAS